MQNIDVLVFDGCPSVETTLEHIREALEAVGKRDAVVRVLRIEDDGSAQRERFVGSPSVRVNGIDVEHAARVRTDFGLQCRVYAVGERLEGAPPVEWIVAALRGERPSRTAPVETDPSACSCYRSGARALKAYTRTADENATADSRARSSPPS